MGSATAMSPACLALAVALASRALAGGFASNTPVPPPAGPRAAASSLFDAGRLRTGRFTYRIARSGAEFARFTLTIQRQEDGRYFFSGEATGFDQHWESVATASFEPVRATLRMGKAGSVFTMRLTYEDGVVTGTQATSAPGSGTGVPPAEEEPIHARVPPGTIDQRIDWAAMLSSHLAAGQKIAFSVYDAKTGVSAVDGSAGGAGRTTVPAGAFETVELRYRIRKATGAEEYRIDATRDAPRIMVREDFPGGNVTELVEIAAASEAPGPR